MSTESESKSHIIRSLCQPTSLLPTTNASTFNHIHTILLPAYYTFRFPTLVSSPISTLFSDLLALALIQTAYATLCLPPTQTTASGPQTRKTKTSKPRLPSLSTKITTALLALVLTALASTPFLAVMMVLFGAPLTTHHAQTYLCASHMALLGAFPLFYVHGVAVQPWREIGGAVLPFDGVWGQTVGTMLGAWLGAVPIPLDWDRDWQTWPITIVTGAYIGAVLGKLAGEYVFRGKRIKFE